MLLKNMIIRQLLLALLLLFAETNAAAEKIETPSALKEEDSIV